MSSQLQSPHFCCSHHLISVILISVFQLGIYYYYYYYCSCFAEILPISRSLPIGGVLSLLLPEPRSLALKDLIFQGVMTQLQNSNQ